jgi:hypothetical protein
VAGRKLDLPIEGPAGVSALLQVGFRFFRVFRREDLGPVAVNEIRVLLQLFAPHDGHAIADVVGGLVFKQRVTKADVHFSARLQECVAFEVNSRFTEVELTRRIALVRPQVFDADRANIGKTSFISSLKVMRRLHITYKTSMEARITGGVNYAYRPVELDTLGFCATYVSLCLRVYYEEFDIYSYKIALKINSKMPI